VGKTSIEWCDYSWTPLRARVKSNARQIAEAKGYTSLVKIATTMAGHVGPHCEGVSPGCQHCYSETNNGRCLTHNGTGLPFDRRARDLVDIFLDEKMLAWPLHWKKPRMVFVCSQTDLWADFVPLRMVAQIYAVMRLAHWHSYQVLTKRPEVRLAAFNSARFWELVEKAEEDIWDKTHSRDYRELPIPSPHIWEGVSVEDQQRADERIPLLLQTPAAVRFVSVEPLLGPVDLSRWLGEQVCCGNEQQCGEYETACCQVPVRGIDWVTVGGESGPGARPCEISWVRSVRDQCQAAAGVACFVKQDSGPRPGMKGRIPDELWAVKEFPEVPR